MPEDSRKGKSQNRGDASRYKGARDERRSDGRGSRGHSGQGYKGKGGSDRGGYKAKGESGGYKGSRGQGESGRGGYKGKRDQGEGFRDRGERDARRDGARQSGKRDGERSYAGGRSFDGKGSGNASYRGRDEKRSFQGKRDDSRDERRPFNGKRNGEQVARRGDGTRRLDGGDSFKKRDGQNQRPTHPSGEHRFDERKGKGFERDERRSFDGHFDRNKERGGNRRFEKRGNRAGSFDAKTGDRILKPKWEGNHASPARLMALEVIQNVRARNAFAQELITKNIDGNRRLSEEDRAFATRLILGVVSTRGTLDEIIDRCLESPEDIKPDVRDALRVSAYEIIFLEKEPHAAVDQGVELVRSIVPQASGVANFVLRKIVAAKQEFPFGDPRTSIEAYARLHAFPDWLTQMLIRDLGAQRAHSLMVASNEPATMFVAVNAARAEEGEVEEYLEAVKSTVEPVAFNGEPLPGCFKLGNARVLQDGRIKRLMNLGKLVVSDAAAQAVAQFALPPTMPRNVLEIGAGRGTKTVLLQSNALRRYGSQIEEYVTVDNVPSKDRILKERIETCGIDVSERVIGDARYLQELLPDRTFEMVFVDAPCSGLGTLRRHPEIRWRTTQEYIRSMADIQLDLLKAAAGAVRCGGTLIYATCSVCDAENGSVIKRFLKSSEGARFALADEGAVLRTDVVSGGPDGHFAAKLVAKE